ncbi:Hint domain-containing protein [Pseudaestuariivita rosea]|uniref:Hint domain-containing protein n=1 Tax=Pseudaestuariivita rosea TaxID=2763263 RepID=UPI001ABB5948|nr:Hint domain-containing protein [Pseudaestuariivita rosea]
MPDYSIYVLDEADVFLTGGVGLDGVTQGDGSHLVGETLTINANNWRPIEISDTGDNNFEDNDGNQTLNGDQTIDGTLYSDGTVVEAEYSFVVEDPDGNQYTLVGFNVRDSSPPFATIEGLAFIGTFPPVGVPLTIQSAAEGPDFPAPDYAVPPCFVAGTLIETDRGDIPVEALQPGDQIHTQHDGYQTLRWVGSTRVPAKGHLAPIVFDAGSIGNRRVLRVSPQHRFVCANASVALMIGEDAVLVAAKHFVGMPGVRVAEGGVVDYFHLLFDDHQIIFAEGVATESFYPGDAGVNGFDAPVRAELLALFPELQQTYGQTALPVLKAYEACAVLNLNT